MNRAICEQIQGRRVEIRRLCQRCHVQRLEVFGSATLDRFDPKSSDLDFLVGFQDGFTALDNYLTLAEGLEGLFDRPVDLVIERAVRNPYLRQTINATRQVVYEDRGEEVVAAAGGGLTGRR